GLPVEIARLQQRFGPQLRIRRLSRDALIFAGRLRQLAGLLIGVGDLLGRVLLQLVLGEAAPELLQNLRRSRPVLQVQQGRAGIKSFNSYASCAAAASTTGACSCCGNAPANLIELLIVSRRAASFRSTLATFRYSRCA